MHDEIASVFGSIPADVRDRYGMEESLEEAYRRADAYRWQVYGKYKAHNTRMHEDYFRGRLIDVHKILACFAAAMVDVDLLKYNRQMSEKDGNVHICVARAKYEVAVRSTLRFLYLFMQLVFDKHGKNALKAALVKQGTLVFPATRYEHGGWLYNRISALALNHILGNRIDILSYADMMFWVELYNEEHLGGNVVTGTGVNK